MARATFTVDTQLFRELGDLLVGRDSTALAELIKNAYDADARVVIVSGAKLDDPKNGWIQVVDDGVGMTHEQFTKGFLTIAGRSKTLGNRKSAVFGRVFTGEKGVGRLAARKLARKIVVESWAYNGEKANDGSLLAGQIGIKATIDWDAIEQLGTLEELEETSAVTIEPIRAAAERPKTGTSITLAPLRRTWAKKDIDEFLIALAGLSPSPQLISPLPNGFGGKLLFDDLPLRDTSEPDHGFQVELDGEFFAVEPPQSDDVNSASFVVEIKANPKSQNVRYALAPSAAFLERYPNARKEEAVVPISELDFGAEAIAFRARIFERHFQTWRRESAGVRVYMEGFRVLPYGAPNDDWILIDYDYSNRPGRQLLRRLQGLEEFLPEGVKDESLSQKRNWNYMGAVALTRSGSEGMELLVNREGFVPCPQFNFLQHAVRIGIDLIMRCRYKATHEIDKARQRLRAEIRSATEHDNEEPPHVLLLRQAVQGLTAKTTDLRERLARGDVQSASAAVKSIEVYHEQLRSVTEEMGSEQAMFRVLASVGAQLDAFSHEMNALLSLADTILKKINDVRARKGLTSEVRGQLGEIYRRTSDLRHSIEQHALYLSDVAGIEARRRRTRSAFADRLDAAKRLLKGALNRAGVTVDNQLPSELRGPPMFPAEVVALFTNLLSNAIKAAGKGGDIIAHGRTEHGETLIVVENTGVMVDIQDSEKWFEPFRSTTVKPDAVLGQGMGLGLTIVRSILDEYGASVRFIKPSKGFSTAIQMRFPAK